MREAARAGKIGRPALIMAAGRVSSALSLFNNPHPAMRYLQIMFLPALVASFAGCMSGQSAPVPSPDFASATIHIGVVVSDLSRSLDFYENVIGMTRTGGFDIDGDFGRRSGLTGGAPFSVAVLKLRDEAAATQWKLMSFGKDRTHPKSAHIQDDLGVQYVTLTVKDLQPFLDRLAAHQIPLLGDTPITLGDGRRFALVQDPDGAFIELIAPPLEDGK